MKLAPFPHRGGCPQCRNAKLCNHCGATLVGDVGRCTNGRCNRCHIEVCTGGGVAEPGHGYGSQEHASELHYA